MLLFVSDDEKYDFRFVLMDVDKTAFKKTIVVETLKRSPKLALKLLFKHPRFYFYGALYKFFGTDSLRRKFFEQMKHVPIAEFDVKDIDPDYMRILRLAERQGHKVIFLTSNPERIAKKWEERMRNMFPQLDFEVRSVPTVEEKLRFAKELARVAGEDRVHFFDDSLPGTAEIGNPFTRTKMEMDKAVLLHLYEKEIRRWDDTYRRYYEESKRRWEKMAKNKFMNNSGDRVTEEVKKKDIWRSRFARRKEK